MAVGGLYHQGFVAAIGDVNVPRKAIICQISSSLRCRGKISKCGRLGGIYPLSEGGDDGVVHCGEDLGPLNAYKYNLVCNPNKQLLLNYYYTSVVHLAVIR